ncbi:MAG: acyl carrier protein [Candidatus Symbiothrix sp.]|jgi:acyl carrier protein|nr:acyl carrier protein [Candidatus Symbiothrix sp.]
MDELFGQLVELFEVESLDSNDNLVDLDMWDSLTQLSIIALAEENYGITVSAAELRDAQTIGGVIGLFEHKKKSRV